ncbi:MAG: hypothetical protein JNM68_13055 [Dinghuibacter sp.]|nr:hypothetical protein [Dinghuibacter sp.]
MTTKLLLCLAFFIAVQPIAAQKKYSPEEIKRIADLGKLWGILHYLHPSLANGTITTESLIVDNAAILAENPTKEHFRKAVEDMLARTKDPYTRIYRENKSIDTAHIFTSHPDSIALHRLANGVLYIACPTSAIKNLQLFNRNELAVSELNKSKGIVFDLRNKHKNDSYYDDDFVDVFVNKYIGSLAEEGELRSVRLAFIEHNGFVGQRHVFDNIYKAGWKTEGDEPVFPANDTTPAINVPVGFVVNSNSQLKLVSFLQSLQFAKKAVVIHEGALENYRNSKQGYVFLADSIMAEYTFAYKIMGNNFLPPAPDQTVQIVTETGLFMNEAADFVLYNRSDMPQRVQVNMDYVYPRPKMDYSMYPDMGSRLFGLYNYWNAIHFFFPSKHLIGRNWDSVLDEYIPVFVNARDTFDYFEAMQSLISEIHDSHAGIRVYGNRKAINQKYNFSPPVLIHRIEGKPYVIYIDKTSQQKTDHVQVFDEVVKLDGIPVLEFEERFRKTVSSSNETAYHDVVTKYLLLTGANKSEITLTLKRNNKIFDVSFMRTSIFRFPRPDSLVNFSIQYPVSRIIAGDIGYINMDKITNRQVDSVMGLMANTKAIIFDVRNYPKGTVDRLAAYFTEQTVATQFNQLMLVSYASLQFGARVNVRKTDYDFVKPRKDGLRYKGKAVVLCNEYAVSHSEYSIMKFQSAAKAKVIGSQTIGADGNISEIIFPGGYGTWFSALGVYYPNGTETQRVGVKIDIEVKPTVNGIKAGRDEVLERAIRYIKTGK